MVKKMSYQEVEALKKGDRVAVHQFWGNLYRPGTVTGSTTLLGGPSLWIQYDGDSASTNVATGMQFTEDAWNESWSAHTFGHVDWDE